MTEDVCEILGFGLQRKEQGRLVELLIREKMDDRMVRRKSLSERLGFKGISCCGATWALMTSDITATDGEEGTRAGNGSEEEIIETTDIGLTEPEPTCLDQTPAAAASGMNLAAALAAERNYRAAQDNSYGDDSSPSQSPSRSQIRPNIGEEVNGGSGSGVRQPGTPFRVSLMKLLQETDGCDRVTGTDGVGGGDSVCCVCMVRKKGAAFIPCGHTFCRVCSRELWLNRGFCPLCNRSIIEILDIF